MEFIFNTAAEDLLNRGGLFDRIFGEVVPDCYGQLMTHALHLWCSVSAVSIAKRASEGLGINLNSDIGRGYLKAAELADEPIDGDLEYHNNFHYRKVAMQGIRLIRTHNAMVATGELEGDPISAEEAALVMSALFTHDYQRLEGNGKKEAHVPFKQENKSFSLVWQKLEDAGLPEQRKEDFRTLLLCTDCSGAPSPASLLTKLYKGEEIKNLPDELRPLLANKRLQYLAMMVITADIGTSMGLSWHYAELEDRQVCDEEKDPNRQPGPASIKWFLENIGCNAIVIAPAKRLYGDTYRRLLAKCEQLLAPGSDPEPSNT